VKWTTIFGQHATLPLCWRWLRLRSFAWPLENVPACVLAAVMIVVAGSITVRAHFRSARCIASPHRLREARGSHRLQTGAPVWKATRSFFPGVEMVETRPVRNTHGLIGGHPAQNSEGKTRHTDAASLPWLLHFR
jgi:hypothetical protein